MRNLILALALVTVGGCKKQVRSSAEAANALQGFPYNVELFTPSEFDRRGGAGSGFADKHPWYHWDFKTSGTYSDVVAFYDQRLSGAKREIEADDEEDKEPLVSWTFLPAGAQDSDERVTVSVQKVGLTDKPHTKLTVAWSADASRFPK